jgi:hypothetical protein
VIIREEEFLRIKKGDLTRESRSLRARDVVEAVGARNELLDLWTTPTKSAEKK